MTAVRTVARPEAHSGPTAHPALMTAEEAAQYLRISPSTVRIWAAAGRLPKVKLGTSLRFRREALDEWIARNEQGVA